MTDILQEIDVRVSCARCDETYAVSAAAIAESHRLLAQGCPGTHHECMPSFLASLVDAPALDSMTNAWSELERHAHVPAVRPALRRHVSIDRDVRPPAGRRRSDGWQAIDRWEDDGGAVPSLPEPARVPRA